MIVPLFVLVRRSARSEQQDHLSSCFYGSKAGTPAGVKPADPDRAVKHVGRRIAEAREARGRTQEEVASSLGLAPRNYQRIERGEQNLTIKTIVRVANELGVRPIELWETPRTPRPGPGRPPKTRRA